jgi:hypothetical protein
MVPWVRLGAHGWHRAGPARRRAGAARHRAGPARRLIAAVALASAALAVGGLGGTRAEHGYGPPAAALGVPGGYSTVVTRQTIGPDGGKIGPVKVDGVAVALVVPKGAFSADMQVTLTAPKLSKVGDAGFSGYKAVAGVGVGLQQNGSKYNGSFAKQLAISFASQSINSLSVVATWSGTAFETEQGATVRSGSATVGFDKDPDFAVLARTAIQGGTSPSTGKPLTGEAILAVLLLLLGIGGLAHAVGLRTGS